MEEITLKIKNKRKFDHFISFIKDLDFVEIVDSKGEVKGKRNALEDDFFALAGIWENRKIDAKKLRNKAWPQR